MVPTMFDNQTYFDDVTEQYNTGVPDTEDHIVISNQNQVLNVLLYIIGSFGFLGNLLVVVVIFQYTKMRRVLTNIYVINQSILDATAGLMLVLTNVFEDDGLRSLFSVADDVYCRLWLSKVPLWSMLFSSTYNLVALTLERYLGVVHPIKHRVSMTTNKVMASIVAVWMVGFSIQIPLKVATGYIEGGRCHTLQRWPNLTVQRAMGVVMVCVQFIIPLAIISICYCRMYLMLRVNSVHPAEHPGNSVQPARGEGNSVQPTLCQGNSVQPTRGQGESVQPSENQGNSLQPTESIELSVRQGDKERNKGIQKNKESKMGARARKNIFKTLLIVSVCYILCWMWNQGYFFLFNLGLVGPMFTSPYYSFSVVMVSLNCCINPVIYVIHYEQFKRGLRHLRHRILGGDLQRDESLTLTHSVSQNHVTTKTRETVDN